MKVLIACEESQTVAAQFRLLGHEAFSCDLQYCSGGHPEWHIMDDATRLINGFCSFYTCDGKLHNLESKWDLLIAHPPCTYMSKAGARWMYPKTGVVDPLRLELALAAKEFFFQFYNADCPLIAIENPKPLRIVGLPKPTQIIQPYLFGDPFSKETWLWLKGLPVLEPTNILYQYTPYLPSNTSNRCKGKYGSIGVAAWTDAKIRSKTFNGIASAMASQWSLPVESFELQLSLFD